MTGLAWHNRRVLAERLHWPAGALEECERLGRPRWWVVWDLGCTTPGWVRPAGYRAEMVGTAITWWTLGGLSSGPWTSAATPAELAERMAEVQEGVEAEEERRARPLRSLVDR
ncbi:hypothetical protein [Actinoplanes palleronii]|uniref:Uncharacterized protein n=1 Tax=Actinoplanes palleronii TaxID=113570 RepID=A0ABQ4BJC6_9ACTN|nr:hypothetical protein [Actinoplanes palleronii]GIE70707.1 hypothetical protein Apa02nite_068150 [Actinoplanes palleronii]